MEQATDVTKEVFQYGELRRFLWNTYFAHQIDDIMHPRVDIFFDIEHALFRAIILEAREEGLGNCSKEQVRRSRKHLRVSLKSPVAALTNTDKMPRRAYDKKLLSSHDWQDRYLLFVDFF